LSHESGLVRTPVCLDWGPGPWHHGSAWGGGGLQLWPDCGGRFGARIWELSEEYIIPSIFKREMFQAVAQAVREAAIRTGVARVG